ncbi:TrbC family F-type conjugative pilus assembly protein [Photorhabdus aegyptia]|uniref:Type-F conjugative transfer system pilin assembly protein n=1 Tax=Photorhabdus aegyptia TaxID=2805098 RepID=A0A022PHV1_9GAMM|nr:TrbC family F-type conjugative pilus assembly protein [Photorhabdus aegyptia]EYU15114.1 Type-F conjugative transfer system pilin assembly protein [Photorhabdus aegyptia]
MVIYKKISALQLTTIALVVLTSTAACSAVERNIDPKITESLPTRPVTPYTDSSLPSRPAELSEAERNDIDHLIKAAFKSQKKEETEAKEAHRLNREKMSIMPVAKTADELISDTVTGSIANSDIADTNQNKVAGDFYYVLVSSTLGDDELKDMMHDYDGHNNVALVIRGVKEKKNLLQELTRWQQLVLDSGTKVTVYLDPVIFKNYNIISIPTIIHEKDGEFVARVTGTTNIDYLKGKKGNLGTAGPTKDVAEKSLMDMIEKGIKNLDFEKMKQHAIDNYWPRQKFQEFPEAKSRATHYIDPTVIIPQNITAPNGNVITKKGKMNPLDIMPFYHKLIFFDARVEWQRKFARAQFENTEPGIIPILITTNVYGNGWQTFKDTELYYGKRARLYMIQPDMADRFGIVTVPSVVTSDKKAFIVDEYSKTDFKEEVQK